LLNTKTSVTQKKQFENLTTLIWMAIALKQNLLARKVVVREILVPELANVSNAVLMVTGLGNVVGASGGLFHPGVDPGHRRGVDSMDTETPMTDTTEVHPTTQDLGMTTMTVMGMAGMIIAPHTIIMRETETEETVTVIVTGTETVTVMIASVVRHRGITEEVVVPVPRHMGVPRRRLAEAPPVAVTVRPTKNPRPEIMTATTLAAVEVVNPIMLVAVETHTRDRSPLPLPLPLLTILVLKIQITTVRHLLRVHVLTTVRNSRKLQRLIL